MSPPLKLDRPPHTPGLKNCPCRSCRDRHNARAKQIRRLRAYGRWDPWADAEPVREHVRGLMASGLGWMRVAALTDVPKPTLSRLLYGVPSIGVPPSRRVRSKTAAALLALRPSLDLLDPNGLADPTGTRRRYQALAAKGFPDNFMAEMTGASDIARKVARARVRARTARSFIELYDKLKDADPLDYGIPLCTKRKVMNRAAKQGWLGPDYWDEGTIDDPEFTYEEEKQTRQQSIIEDALFVAAQEKYIREHIARRLGITPDYLDRAIDRAGGVYKVFGRGLDSPRVYS